MDENNCNSVIFSKDCSKRSTIEKIFDKGRQCYDLPKDSPNVNQPDSGVNKHNPSPFENFEFALFFPSCGFWLIFLFTSFNLVLFQIIFILYAAVYAEPIAISDKEAKLDKKTTNYLHKEQMLEGFVDQLPDPAGRRKRNNK